MLATSIQGKAAFTKLASDSVKNVLFYGIAAAVIVMVGSHLRWLGITLFCIDALVTVIQVGQTAFSTVLGVILFFGKIATGQYGSNDLWWDLTNTVQLLECGVEALYFVWMYRSLFSVSN